MGQFGSGGRPRGAIRSRLPVPQDASRLAPPIRHNPTFHYHFWYVPRIRELLCIGRTLVKYLQIVKGRGLPRSISVTLQRECVKFSAFKALAVWMVSRVLKKDYMMIRTLIACLLAFASLLPFREAYAQTDVPKPPTPGMLKGGQVIDTKIAKQLVDAKGVLFFDMRSPVNFGKGHLPGAKSLPYRENSDFKADFDPAKDQFDLKALPADKGAKLVFYSDGPTGWKSYKASVLAIKAGYTNVHYYRAGTDDWVKAGLPLAK